MSFLTPGYGVLVPKVHHFQTNMEIDTEKTTMQTILGYYDTESAKKICRVIPIVSINQVHKENTSNLGKIISALHCL